MSGRQLDLFTAPAKPSKPAKRRRRVNPWEGLTDEQRLARINAIRVSRGLKPLKELRP